MKAKLTTVLLLAALTSPFCLAQESKPPLTLDEFFNAVEISSVRISPDGRAVVVATGRADWGNNRFRKDLWLYREAESEGKGQLIQLTQSGHDSEPQWSPDGQWIAFLSDRSSEGQATETEAKGRDGEDDEKSSKSVAQLYVIAAHGGEAFSLTTGKEEVHAFAWAADSMSLFLATREPWSKEQDEEYKKQWKDVVRFRESERGDTIWTVNIQAVLSHGPEGEKKIGTNPTSALSPIASLADRVKQLEVSPDGELLAILTLSRSQRWEGTEPYAIFVTPTRTKTEEPLQKVESGQAILDHIAWASDSQHILFSFLNGSVEGPYQDAQSRAYWVAAAGPPQKHTRWAAKFEGAITDFAPLSDGKLLAAGRLGTEVQPYLQNGPASDFGKQPGLEGTYEHFSAAQHSSRVAFAYSSLQSPPEVYLAESPEHLAEGRPITAFNKLLAARELPRGKLYRWKADDGTTVEGMLIYPPGKYEATHLPMFTFIHGGPGDADGNHFEADWYQWSALAATHGWLVFEPNYRGSIGYGDSFALGIIPHIVSRPGKDILEGVDALVKDGTANPDRLTVGGYSYGGYMTNWLLTQTTRFKAAVTGAGAVEHVANWGNDDTTFDDAYFLGGLPWAAQKTFNAEAAIWQIDKVKTPTHIVGGADDIRVYVGEDYLLERALHTLGVPCTLLIFPGEGHELDKNPWHGKIKVREELQWLEKYGGGAVPQNH